MGEINPINKLKDKAPSMVPVEQLSNTEIVEEVKKWYKPPTSDNTLQCQDSDANTQDLSTPSSLSETIE